MLYQDLPIDSMLPRISLCRFFETQNAPPRKTLDRISEFYEVAFYLSDSGAININDKEHSIHYGDIRFTKPGTYLNSIPHYKCFTIYFDFGQSNVIYQNQLLDGIPEYFHTSGEHEKIFEELLQLFNSKDIVAPIKLNTLLLSLLSQLFEYIYSHKKYCAAVETCITYMETHFSQNITLDTLSKISGYSGLHFLRLFKHDTGCTPHDFLTSIRMNSAKNMLIYTDKPLSEIASECGFSSDSHFKILFKKTTGFTPGIYRKNAKMI
ncbi:MAG: helix-turn-helix transcriptional regulator [Lachnospiraceae bacterium]|nr:helix-turn-helix transcriptional regulator [Lachnospiraceae bacterium]